MQKAAWLSPRDSSDNPFLPNSRTERASKSLAFKALDSIQVLSLFLPGGHSKTKRHRIAELVTISRISATRENGIVQA